MYYFGHWDFAAADRESARAVELDKHNLARVHHIRAYVLSTLNRTDEAIKEEKMSMEIDPFAWPWMLGAELIRARQFDAAMIGLQTRRQAQSENASVREVLSQAFWFAGRDQEAAAEYEAMYRLGGDEATADATRAAFSRGGFQAVLELQLTNLKKAAATGYVSPFYPPRMPERPEKELPSTKQVEVYLLFWEHRQKPLAPGGSFHFRSSSLQS